MDTSGGDTDQKAKQDTKTPGYGTVVRPKPTVSQNVGQDKISADVKAKTVRQTKPSTPTAKPAAKEVEYVSSTGEAEAVPVVEVRELGELPEDVEGWLERVEADDVAEPPTVVHEGKPIVSSATPSNVSVTLPLTEEELEKGLHQKLAQSIRWLAEWCKRLVEKFQGKVAYKIGEKK